jgi:uncharacterized membrane protein
VASFRITALTAAVTAAYPVLVYFGLRQGIAPRFLALGLLAVLALRWGRPLARKLPIPLMIACAASVLALAWLRGAASVLWYPVAVNLSLLIVFGASLWAPPTVIERLARLRHPDLDGHGVRYTRKVTRVWCVFFIVNGAAAAATAWYGNQAVWAFYNGILAYLLMGALLLGEWLVRRRVMRAAAARRT